MNLYLCTFVLTVSVILLLILALLPYLLGVSMYPMECLVYVHVKVNIPVTLFALIVSLVPIMLKFIQVGVHRATSAVKMMRVKTC